MPTTGPRLPASSRSATKAGPGPSACRREGTCGRGAASAGTARAATGCRPSLPPAPGATATSASAGVSLPFINLLSLHCRPVPAGYEILDNTSTVCAAGRTCINYKRCPEATQLFSDKKLGILSDEEAVKQYEENSCKFTSNSSGYCCPPGKYQESYKV